MSTGLAADVQSERGGFRLSASLDVPAGSVLAVVGPNASGKSTLLQLLAGLLTPQQGTVRLSGRVLTDVARGIQVPPEHRGIGLLGQDPLLFPHLSVLENVAFGPRSAGAGRAQARRTALHWLDRVGLDGLGARRPGTLSGGQAQRVALARALAARPDVLLLDEPLAALDAETAPVLRQVLAEQLRTTGTTAVVVSHDVLDAALLADQVAVLHEGAVVEHGPVTEVLDAPATRFTAALVGVALVPGVVRAGGVHTAWGGWPVSAIGAAPDQIPDGGPCVVRVRPAAVTVAPAGENAEAGVEGMVKWLEPAAGGVRVRLAAKSADLAVPGVEPGGKGPDAGTDLLADIDPARVDPSWLAPGARVRVRLDPQRLALRRS
ncbi:sulfate/molybdate ABC transporter ATP-binding protein [Ruania alba]|uniref:Molybdate transport system ATP-binding protein n=1 Tax=Ruania alba TaxID=648782 RepID=A0A1H5MVZ9_9MICO|nr:ABC transporter ATP-binding protein [Ruania alba]SEE93320.1 molybdate transport system ATP-binding protein [Ruania alba]